MTQSKVVSISPWINERCPPLHELLSAHDVARLTRRPCWVIAGLSLIGRFPKRLRFRGRAIGWRRSDVLTWMERDLTVTGGRKSLIRFRARRRLRRFSLALRRRRSSFLVRTGQRRRPRARSRVSPRSR